MNSIPSSRIVTTTPRPVIPCLHTGVTFMSRCLETENKYFSLIPMNTVRAHIVKNPNLFNGSTTTRRHGRLVDENKISNLIVNTQYLKCHVSESFKLFDCRSLKYQQLTVSFSLVTGRIGSHLLSETFSSPAFDRRPLNFQKYVSETMNNCLLNNCWWRHYYPVKCHFTYSKRESEKDCIILLYLAGKSLYLPLNISVGKIKWFI